MLHEGQTMQASDPGQIDWLIDKAKVVLRSWKTIVLGTAALTLVGWAVLVFPEKPPSYTAKMILPLSSNVKAMLKAGLVGSGISVDQLPGTSLHLLAVTDSTAERAQASIHAVLDQVILASKPTGSDLDTIQRKIDVLNKSIIDIQALSAAAPPAEKAAASSRLLPSKTEFETRLIDLQNSLTGLRREDVISQAVIMAPRPTRMPTALSVFVVSFLGMLFFIFLYDEWKAQKAPDHRICVT